MNYSTKKPRILSESDLINLKRRDNQKTPSLCNTVEEEEDKEEGNTEESLMTFKSLNFKNSNQNEIFIENGEDTNNSIHQLEDVVGSLLKEQQNLKK